MTSQTLQTIAEVKMYLHDSHAASWNLKQQSCAKRQFGPPSNDHDQEPSQPATPNNPSSSMPPPPTPKRDTETEDELHPIGFREMIEDFNSLGSDEAELSPEYGSTYIWAKQYICDLFDFTSTYWVKENCKEYSQHLDGECSFCEFLSNNDVDSVGVEESRFCDY